MTGGLLKLFMQTVALTAARLGLYRLGSYHVKHIDQMTAGSGTAHLNITNSRCSYTERVKESSTLTPGYMTT